MDTLSTSVLTAAILAIVASLWRPIKDVVHSIIKLNSFKKDEISHIEKELKTQLEQSRLEQTRHQEEIQRHLESIKARTPELQKLTQELQAVTGRVEKSLIVSNAYEKLIEAIRVSQEALEESTRLDVGSDGDKENGR